MSTTNIPPNTEPTTPENERDITDIFHWANQIDNQKQELRCELFVFNRHFTPYALTHSNDLAQQVRILFAFDVINYVNLGAGTGVSVREFEKSEPERDVILRTSVENVEYLATLRHNIENERDKVDQFNEVDHELRKMKGMVARFWHPNNPEKFFYIIKALTPAAVMPGLTAWQVSGHTAGAFAADAGLKIPTDNQVLVIGEDVFVFAAKKFENLFKYNFKEQRLADAKVAEIESAYKLSFPDGMDLQSLVREHQSLARKLQKVEIGSISQDQAIEYADEMQLELMTDTDNSIIIMDNKDLDMFIGLINEDYITSERTGRRYKVLTKKELSESSGGEPPRG